MAPIQFGVRAGNTDSRAVSSELCMNCFVQLERGGKREFTVRGSPGIVTNFTFPTGPHRGHIEMGGQLYAVYGSRLYRTTEQDWAAGNFTQDLGEIMGIDRVLMAENGAQVAIAADGRGYIATSSSVAEITDVDFRTPVSSVDEVDGYFVWSQSESDIWFLSELNDGTAYDPADQAVAESETDEIVRVFTGPGEIKFFGRKTTEPWVNIGTSPFPFERANQGILPEGLYGKHTPVKLDNSFFWVNDDRIVQRFDGRPVRVSTHAIERLLAEVTDEDQLEAWGYVLEGHAFYILAYANQWTRVFDPSTGEWHGRGSTADQNRWRASGVANEPATIFGQWIVGDPTSGRIGYLDPNTYTEWGETMIAVCASQNSHAYPDNALANRLSLDFEFGTTPLMSGQGSDPELMFDYSDDQGNSWKGARTFKLGQNGQYNKTINVTRLPIIKPSGRTFRWSISDPVPRVFIGADLNNGPV